MHIALSGPLDTAAFRDLTGFSLQGAPNGLGGMPMTDLAATLIDMGHKVSIATTDPTIESPLVVEEGGCQIVYCPLRAAPRFKARVRAMDLFEREIAHLTAAIRGFGADIVHAHWTYEFAEAALRSGKPHVVTMHDLGWDYLSLYRDAYRAIRLLMKYRVLVRTRALTVVAPFMAKKAWQYGYFRKAFVVPNSVALPAAGLRDYQILDKPPIICVIGNTGPIKNVSAAISAFEIILASRPDAEMHLFGPGLDSHYVAGQRNVTGHAARPHEELMTFLSEKADLLIHPSRLECCPMIVEEAKIRGVPVVGGRSSGGVAFVCGDAGACLVNVEDPKDIAAGAVRLLDAGQHREARISAQRDAKARFASRPVAEAYLDVYAKVLFNVGR